MTEANYSFEEIQIELNKKGIKILQLGEERYFIYKDVLPPPEDGIEEQLAEEISKKSKYNNISFNIWDMSKPSEQPYSQKAHIVFGEVKDLNNVDKITEEITSFEREYSSKLKLLRKKLKQNKKFSVLDFLERNL